MDELDRKIIGVLQLDGRASNAKITREAGVSEDKVRRWLHHLIQDDVVKVIAVPNLEKLGYATTALIGLQTDPGKSDSVAEAVANLDEAHYVAITTGAYDVFVWVGAGFSRQPSCPLGDQDRGDRRSAAHRDIRESGHQEGHLRHGPMTERLPRGLGLHYRTE